MKNEYPKYKLGDLDRLIKRLPKVDKEAWNGFLKKSSITASEKKVKKISKLLIQLYDVTELPLTKQNKESIDSFLIVLNKCEKSFWTKDEIKIYVKQFLMFHYKDLEMVENFKASGKKGLNPTKITENNLVTDEEVEKMLRQATNFKESAYLLLAFQTGARPQELLCLKWKDITFEDKYADVSLFSNKTQRARTFPVVEKTMKALWDWKEHYEHPNINQNDYVFPSKKREKPFTSAGINKMLRRLAKRAGIKKDVWGYLFRHSKATRLYEELPQQIVEKLMGHKNMAGIYAHISSKKAREELLKKVYHVEELTNQDKKEIADIKKEIAELRKDIALIASSPHYFDEYLREAGLPVPPSPKEFEELVKKYRKEKRK